MKLLVIISVIIILYIYGAYSESLERKRRKAQEDRFKNLTGNYIHKKTSTGVVIEVEYRDKSKVYFRPASQDEITYLKLDK